MVYVIVVGFGVLTVGVIAWAARYRNEPDSVWAQPPLETGKTRGD